MKPAILFSDYDAFTQVMYSSTPPWDLIFIGRIHWKLRRFFMDDIHRICESYSSKS